MTVTGGTKVVAVARVVVVDVDGPPLPGIPEVSIMRRVARMLTVIPKNLFVSIGGLQSMGVAWC